MTVIQPVLSEYTAAHESTILVRFDRGVLRVRGNDRLDLINRLSTNTTIDLNPGSETTTILTSEKGRIREILRLLAFEDHLLVLLDGADASGVQAWFDKYTIMDDFVTEDLGDEYTVFGVYGDAAGRTLSEALGVNPPPSATVATTIFADANLHVIRDVRLSGMGAFLVIGPRSAEGSLISAFERSGVIPIGADTYAALRIEAGRPESGSELTDAYNPLEASLVQYVSFTKGCYIGQEVIARLDSYDKVQRHLVGLLLDAEPESGEELRVFDSVDRRPIGTLTSLAYSPRLERPIALAYVKTLQAVPGLNVTVATSADDAGTGAIVTKLPFDL